MRRSALSPVEQTRMISFDGGIAEPVMRQRPDWYRLLHADLSRRPRIIAANVHGQNPSREGTFVGSLVDLTLFHPDHGVIRITREKDPGLFDLTCGGFGLTGIIFAATLRLEPLAGNRVSIRRVSVGDALEAIAMARNLAGDSLFAYTWHDAAPRGRSFGRAFVYHGLLKSGPVDPDTLVPRYRVPTSAARARLPFSLWQPLTVRAFTSALWHGAASGPEIPRPPCSMLYSPLPDVPPISAFSDGPGWWSTRRWSRMTGPRPSSASYGSLTHHLNRFRRKTHIECCGPIRSAEPGAQMVCWTTFRSSLGC